MSNLDERTKTDFLVYANSVIKSRAIPFVEDNLKPVHRRILYTLWMDKVFADKKTKKCATEVGRTMALNPHGDAAIYGALVRLSQPWKLRYPLIDLQGSNGNLLGDPFAASRYTECRLSPFGMLMLDGVDNNAVDMKPNYDETIDEPITLPSRFPYLLCGNNSGIAVGMSSDLVSHNFTEVAAAIKYYLNHKDCSIVDLMQFIKGPDFPTKGKILNGEDLLQIYTKGQGAVRVQAHYDVQKKSNGDTLVVFHDVPYGIEITDGILKPLKSLVIDEGYDCFKDFYTECTNPEMQYYDITITIAKNHDLTKALEVLFQKTRLEDSIKINQTVIINGEPRTLSLKQMIEYWVNYRSNIIKRVNIQEYEKTNHKLTVTIGLQKCMSNIDLLVQLIRNADNRAAAAIAIKKEFELNDEQADAVLDMKLSKLSKLDLTELNDTEKKLRETLARLQNIIDNESARYDIIANDLDEIKKMVGTDERLTEISYHHPVASVNAVKVKEEWFIYPDGVANANSEISIGGSKVPHNNLICSVFAYDKDDIYGFNSNGEIAPISKMSNMAGAFVKGKDKLVCVTANGNVKVSLSSEYNWKKIENAIKRKDGDNVVLVATANDTDCLVLYDGENHLLKLSIKDLPVASKNTVGVKSGFAAIKSAMIVTDNDLLLCGTADNKYKFTAVKDFSIDSRGNKGQILPDNTTTVKYFDNARDNIYVLPKLGNMMAVSKSKISIKSRTASGATVSTKIIKDIF